MAVKLKYLLTAKYAMRATPTTTPCGASIKSMRASDENGEIRWLAKMLHAGDDFRSMARRIVIFASEDVGVADQETLPLDTSWGQSVIDAATLPGDDHEKRSQCPPVDVF